MQYIDKFTTYLSNQKHLSNTTKKQYITDVVAFITWVEKMENKQFSPQEIRKLHIQEYKKSLQLSESSKQRYLSSLRKFFHFLKTEKVIAENPLEKEKRNDTSYRKWKLSDFENYLYIYNASELTIKYYLLDVKHFLIWIEKEKENTAKNVQLVDEYIQYLLERQNYSQATLHRKQSAIRKYLLWYVPTA